MSAQKCKVSFLRGINTMYKIENYSSSEILFRKTKFSYFRYYYCRKQSGPGFLRSYDSAPRPPPFQFSNLHLLYFSVFLCVAGSAH
jgi:hypothetical protein